MSTKAMWCVGVVWFEIESCVSLHEVVLASPNLVSFCGYSETWEMRTPNRPRASVLNSQVVSILRSTFFSFSAIQDNNNYYTYMYTYTCHMSRTCMYTYMYACQATSNIMGITSWNAVYLNKRRFGKRNFNTATSRLALFLCEECLYTLSSLCLNFLVDGTRKHFQRAARLNIAFPVEHQESQLEVSRISSGQRAWSLLLVLNMSVHSLYLMFRGFLAGNKPELCSWRQAQAPTSVSRCSGMCRVGKAVWLCVQITYTYIVRLVCENWPHF